MKANINNIKDKINLEKIGNYILDTAFQSPKMNTEFKAFFQMIVSYKPKKKIKKKPKKQVFHCSKILDQSQDMYSSQPFQFFP